MRTCFMKYVKFTSILCDNSLSTIMFKIQHIFKVYKRMRYHKQTLCPLFVCDIMGIAFHLLLLNLYHQMMLVCKIIHTTLIVVVVV